MYAIGIQFCILRKYDFFNKLVYLSGEGGQMGYGRQRVWGTIGFGIAAFLAGYMIDLWSDGEIYKSYTPAFILVFTFTCIDLICCKKLEVLILYIKKKQKIKII